MMRWTLAMMLLGALAVQVQAQELVVSLPDDAKAREGLAENAAMKLETAGVVEGATVRFPKLLPDTPYDVTITLRGWRTLVGVDLGWYEQDTAEEPKPDQKPPAAMTDDDREQIRAIVQDVPSFYDKAEILKLAGDGERAVALVQLVRDRDFHGAQKGEIVWRVELYYFRFQAGGWEKVQQASRVLRRARFRNPEQFEDETRSVTWVESLGGVRVGKDQTQRVDVKP